MSELRPAMRETFASVRLPRDLHPAAWWLWALGLAVAASRTTNPWLLLLIVAVACHVVVSCRSEAPWALAFRLYLYLGAVIVALRILFRIVFGGADGPTVLVRLPELGLPEWAAGIRLLGDVSAESLLAGLFDGMRLATMIVCLGAANALANPKRLLKSLPPALYEMGAAIVIALSVFPQLAESFLRVRRARRLRGDAGRRFRALRTIVIPVLEDALDRSLQLAASMDSRGYGRSGAASPKERAVTGALMIGGLFGVCVGVYATLDGTAPRYLAAPMLFGGLLVALVGFGWAGRRVRRTRYRPDRWRLPEILVASSGVAAAVALIVAARLEPATVYPQLAVLAWPELAALPLAGVVCGLLPSVVSPPPEPPFASGHADADAAPAREGTPA